MWSDYYRHNNGTDALYALPLQSGIWSDTIIASGNNENQSTLYIFNELQDDFDFEVFLQSGLSPSEGDLPLALLNYSSLPRIESKINILVNNATNSGPGAIETEVIIKDSDSQTISNVDAWVSLDEEGLDIIAGTLKSNGLGVVKFMLDPGVYYLWVQKNEYNFNNPSILEVE